MNSLKSCDGIIFGHGMTSLDVFVSGIKVSPNNVITICKNGIYYYNNANHDPHSVKVM